MADKSRRIGSTVRDVVNTTVLIIWFMFYALTFMVPKFYGLTEDYVGVFVFFFTGILILCNVNLIEAFKTKDIELFVLIGIGVVTLLNLVIVRSGFGAFFVAADFAMIWYLSGKITLRKWQLYLMLFLYGGLMLYWFFDAYGWMFAEYGTYAMNTNTAATFTVYSLLVLFLLAELLIGKCEAAGLLMVIILIKGIQLTLYHRGRGSFIMLIIFVIFRFVIPAKWWKNKAFYRAVCIFATFGSLLFVGIYVAVGMMGVNFRIPFFYKNMFSGREAIWLEFWNLFRAKPLTGIGTNVTITSFFEFNVHNAMYNILVIHGILVFAATLFLVFRRLNIIHKTAYDKGVSFAAVSALFAVFIESFFDVDLIWTDYSLNLLMLLIAAHMGSEGISDNDISKQ